MCVCVCVCVYARARVCVCVGVIARASAHLYAPVYLRLAASVPEEGGGEEGNTMPEQYRQEGMEGEWSTRRQP